MDNPVLRRTVYQISVSLMTAIRSTLSIIIHNR